MDPTELSKRLWAIRLALSFGTTDVNAAFRVRDALRDLDQLRADLELETLKFSKRMVLAGGKRADGIPNA